MDADKIINSVFAQTKTKITADDPLFALVAMNEAVLTEFLARATEEIQVAANEIELQTGAHIAAAKELDNRLLEIRKLVSEHVKNEVGKSKELVKADMQAAAVEALKGGVDATSLSISKMEQAYIAAHNKLLLSLEKAEQRVDEIQPMAKWECLIYAMLGSAVGALAMVLAQKFSH